MIDTQSASHGIVISNLTKRYQSRSGEQTVALDNINAEVPAGQFVTVLGPSGCGKSTLMHIVAGLLDSTQGSVLVRGQPVLGPRRDVGVVFQNALLLPWRTILDNVLLPAIVQKLDVVKAKPRALELLQLVGLAGFENRYPNELSGGMQQRAAIARALLNDPSVLLMDEPFGALDAMTREQMNLDLLDIWQASRKTVLLITHSILEAVFLADRVLVMSARPGRVVEDITIDLPRPRTLAMLTSPELGHYALRARALLDNCARALLDCRQELP